MRYIKTALTIIGLLFLAFIFARGKPPVPSAYASSPIDASGLPEQSDAREQAITMDLEDGSLSIVPLKHYKIAAKVLSASRYRFDKAADFAPVDLALGWGKLSDDEILSSLKFWQSGRWYWFRFYRDSAVMGDYIRRHSSNVHIIPANENVKRAVLRVKKKQLVELEGCLVRITGEHKGGAVLMQSSTSRNDAGGGACEVMYVEKIRIRDEIFE